MDSEVCLAAGYVHARGERCVSLFGVASEIPLTSAPLREEECFVLDAGNACASGVVIALRLPATQCALALGQCLATREIDDQFWDLLGGATPEPERRSSKSGAIRILYRIVRARHFPIRRFSC